MSPFDEHARLTIENEASKLYEASPWAADKRAAEIVRPAPVQTAGRVPPKSLARDMAFAKLQSRILSAAEAVQAAKLHSEMLPEQQAIVLSAGGPGTGTCWTGRAQVTNGTGTECAMEDGHGVTACCYAGRRPRIYVWSEEGQTMGTCASSLWQRTRSTLFAVSTGEKETDNITQSSAHCAGSLSRQGTMQTNMERHRHL